MFNYLFSKLEIKIISKVSSLLVHTRKVFFLIKLLYITKIFTLINKRADDLGSVDGCSSKRLRIIPIKLTFE